MGRVTSVDQTTLHATSGPQGTLTNLTISLAAGGRVWKKDTFKDFSEIRVGDFITVRGYRTSQGELSATEIYANINRVTGVVTSMRSNEFDVAVLNESGQPRGETVTVSVDAQTVTCRDASFSARVVRNGSYVEVIGLSLSRNRIAATRVDVFVGGRQVC